MSIKATAEDVQQYWLDYRAQPSEELRNRLIENYFQLVKFNENE